MSDDCELGGEDEMRDLFNVNIINLREVWDAHRRPDEHFCVNKAYTL